ncbi:MAG: hypothetical protein US86_C0001G0113 [Candidatus Daviesbacteria bacterium GW2011_GWA2_38_24]|uniref:Uncharacterized protein n=1 Tax=Candidatus Daviesbacteria bacterium GW2011_GWA2_38_24 TaxID=1618422 RepID=A0A0G0MQK3_9BACT|nr:MAG: hypothetical protein US86_C0001G0113 [Candidatus Daviesbacteria bacterium GW2011_GWA2_38_24]KKQ81044.1 MAG: hypothetical protein UT01_C0001G0027 [Candidatus Daviesbacteria bacterium GW2011_GWA1_38_7]
MVYFGYKKDLMNRIPISISTICLSLILSLVFLNTQVLAGENEESCDRYVTLVNPVRGRSLWIDSSLKPIDSQYEATLKNNLKATWLVQYDVLEDEELKNRLKEFNDGQEIGVFLEVSELQSNKSKVIYPPFTPWFSPKAVFLSGYKQSERRRLIDTLFEKFKQTFNYYPKSVGAWWIDSYSLNYIKDKYDIRAALIVADQLTTDNYGVWGQWWSVPYYPSKANILTPASSIKNKQDVVVVQWALRDPLLAYGSGKEFSNYSLQANDYVSQGKDTSYFNEIASSYLSCQNQLSQITVGLETGIESISFISEYNNQLLALKNTPNLSAVTMSEFAEKFANKFPEFPKSTSLSYKGSSWIMDTQSRKNEKLNDFVSYDQKLSFSDYFVADKEDFLNRIMPLKRANEKVVWFPMFIQRKALLILIFLVFGIIFYIKKDIKLFIIGSLFSFAAFGLILRSFYQFGWQVFFGPKVSYLILVQAMVVIISFLIVFLVKKRFKINLWLLPLVFGIDFLIQGIRGTYMSGRYFIGFALDDLRFLGLSFSKGFQLNFVNQDLPAYQALALLKFDFNMIWNNLIVSLFIYPLIHIIFALVLGTVLMKAPEKVWKLVFAILIILVSLHLTSLLNADPRLVL